MTWITPLPYMVYVIVHAMVSKQCRQHVATYVHAHVDFEMNHEERLP